MCFMSNYYSFYKSFHFNFYLPVGEHVLPHVARSSQLLVADTALVLAPRVVSLRSFVLLNTCEPENFDVTYCYLVSLRANA